MEMKRKTTHRQVIVIMEMRISTTEANKTSAMVMKR